MKKTEQLFCHVMPAKAIIRFQTFVCVFIIQKRVETSEKKAGSNRSRKLYQTSQPISVFASTAEVAKKGDFLG